MLFLGLCESVIFVRAIFSRQPNNRSLTLMKVVGLFKPWICLLVILSLLNRHPS